MLYAIIFIVAAIVLAYGLGLWLVHETREASGALGARLKRLTGGWTSEALLHRTRATCAQYGLDPDLIAVSSAVTPVYDALRRRILGGPVDAALPAGLVLALGLDQAKQSVYLHAVEAPKPARAGSERQFVANFDDVDAINTVSNPFDGELSPPGERAVSLRVAGTAASRYDVIVEPAWAVGADELASQLRAMIFDRKAPQASPVVVR